MPPPPLAGVLCTYEEALAMCPIDKSMLRTTAFIPMQGLYRIERRTLSEHGFNPWHEFFFVRPEGEPPVGNFLIKCYLIARDGTDLCAYCKLRVGDTLDHVEPRSRGGEDHHVNMVLACGPCNRKKANRTVEEWLRGIQVVENPDGTKYKRSTKKIFMTSKDDWYTPL